MEITFRGKRTDNNEWIYGDLMQNEEGCFISVDSETNDGYGDGTELYSTYWYKVREGSVGQYINRDDINSMDVYMGDIVKFKDLNDGTEGVGIVQYANCSFYINTGHMNCYRWTDYEIEIIGNGIENPELIKEILE